MKRLRRFLFSVLMVFAVSVIGFTDVNTYIVEFDGDYAEALFTCEFTMSNGLPIMAVGYYPFVDVLLFNPEITIEQAHVNAKYDIFGIDNLIYVASPTWYDLGGNISEKQTIVMYVALPYNFKMNEDVIVYFETVNGMVWHQFTPANSKSNEPTYWHNGKKLELQN